MDRYTKVWGPERLRLLFASDPARPGGSESLAQFLGRTALFGGLQDRDLERLARHFHVRRFDDGESIYEEGRPAAALFLVRKGEVEITKRTPEGSALSLATLAPPASFDELAALGSDVVHWVSARARGSVELLALGRSDVESLSREAPAAANKVIVRVAEATSRRLRALPESQGRPSDAAAG